MPEVETARLRLRMFKHDDLADYQAQIYGDTEAMRYLPGGKPRPIEQTQAILTEFIDYWQSHNHGMWAVTLKDSGNFIGHCGLLYLKNGVDIELVYAYGKDYWGQGLGSEAAKATLRYGFETAGLERIVALAFPENVGSQRVMQKIDMKSEGITNRYYNADLALYSINRADFQPDGSVYILHP
jgi:RimJ/RimL family protein N-acetyltransferase